MKTIHVKKKMLYWLLGPYLLTGIIAVLFLGYKYNTAVEEMKQKYYEDSCAILNKVNREVDYLVSDIENLVVEIELNNKLLKPLSVPKEGRSGEENYSIAMALKELKNIKKYNHLIEDVILYYRKGDFFLNPLSIRTEKGIYEDYPNNQTISYEVWSKQLTGEFWQGRLVTAGDSVFYIVTVPFHEETENCNIIVKINSAGFSELLNNYNLVNENAVYLFNGDMILVDSNNIGDTLVLDDEIKKKIADEVQTDSFSKRIIRLADANYEGVYIQSSKSDLVYVLLADKRRLESRIDYVTAMYLGGGVLFGLLLFLGLYGISVNYRHILSIIERLKKNSGGAAETEYSEFDYINSALNDLEEKMNLQESAVIDNYIRMAIYGLIDEDDSNGKNLFAAGGNLGSGQSMIAIFEECTGVKRDVKEAKLNLFIIGNVLKDIFEDNIQCFIVSVYQWQIVILNWCGKETMKKDCVLEGLVKMQKFLAERLELFYTIGISDSVTGIKQFADGYQQAMAALEEKQVLGERQVISYIQLSKESRHFEYTEAMEKQLKNYIRLGDERKAVSGIEEIYDEAFHRNPISIEAGKMLLLNLIKSVNEVSREKGCSFSVDALAVLKKDYSAHRMKNNILEVITHLCELSVEQVDNADRRHNQIQQYISQHYRETDLNVAMIADEFHLNASYLSRFFKEETGENLLNYINCYRIEKAKELLSTTDETLAAVAEETGLLNAAALSRTFKKIEGITPGQYRVIHRTGRK